MHSIAIVALSIVACAIYGVVHDQLTARLCLEYFTVFHAPVFQTENPTLLGLGWGVYATWWVGLFFGIPLAVVSRAGSPPKLTWKQLVWPTGVVLIAVACAAGVAGLFAFLAASAGWISMSETWATRVSPEKHVLFLVDLWMHNASYSAGFVCGFAGLGAIWRRRLLLDRGSP